MIDLLDKLSYRLYQIWKDQLSKRF